MNRPWFKAYAADYLLDPKIDALPPEAEGLVWRIWCICHMEGSCPADPTELARKIRRPVSYVLKYKSYYESLFELKDGSYISIRMERERRRSETNRANVSARYKQKTSTIRTTNGNTTGRDFVVPLSDYDSDSGVDVDLELNVREIAKFHPKILDPVHIPTDVAYAIAEAVARHGADTVLVGTKSMAEAVTTWPASERQFIPSAPKYYRESQYLKDPREWERGGNGNSKTGPVNPTAERDTEIIDSLLGAARNHAAKRDANHSVKRESDAERGSERRVATGSV